MSGQQSLDLRRKPSCVVPFVYRGVVLSARKDRGEGEGTEAHQGGT